MEELLRAVPLFAWLPEGAPDILNSCFDLETERLAAGETRRADGRAGCLLEGAAAFCPQFGEARTLESGALFAIARNRDRHQFPVHGTLTAVSDCAVAWFDINLTRTVCYRACWFHVRLLREIGAQLDAQDG